MSVPPGSVPAGRGGRFFVRIDRLIFSIEQNSLEPLWLDRLTGEGDFSSGLVDLFFPYRLADLSPTSTLSMYFFLMQNLNFFLVFQGNVERNGLENKN